MKSNARYRVWQFWQSLQRSPDENDLPLVNDILTPVEFELFKQLPVPDQNHSIRVLKSLKNQAENDPDLLKAALLHDLGKMKYPLRGWERVFSVLISRLFPKQVRRWGRGEPTGLRRSLVILQHHPDWGAELAQKAGCSERVVWFIKHHENMDHTNMSPDKIQMLTALQAADNNN